MPFSLKRRHATLLAASALLAGCAAEGPKAAPRPPDAVVRVTHPLRRDVPFEVRAVGNAEAFSTVAVKSRVSGLIVRVAVQEGHDVQAGALLFELDARPFEERVRAAEAALARDRAAERQSLAEIERAKAQAANARAQWDRYQKLLAEGIAARQQADEIRSASLAAEAQLNVVNASLDSVRANIRADEARLAEAKLELGYTKITAPTAGRAGFMQIKAGNLVRENDAAPLLTLAQQSPIYVAFAVPEQYLQDIRAQSAGGRKLPVEVLDESEKPIASGSLAVMDNAVDPATGTIKLKALFPNAGRLLWPGQFVTVRLALRVDSNVLTVPAPAVQEGPEGSFLWIVTPKNTAELRKVKVARTYSNFALVESGLADGENVVLSGQLRLAPGRPVKVAQ
jgi:membrane fusion protein, multidrug efflux system